MSQWKVKTFLKGINNQCIYDHQLPKYHFWTYISGRHNSCLPFTHSPNPHIYNHFYDSQPPAHYYRVPFPLILVPNRWNNCCTSENISAPKETTRVIYWRKLHEKLRVVLKKWDSLIVILVRLWIFLNFSVF